MRRLVVLLVCSAAVSLAADHPGVWPSKADPVPIAARQQVAWLERHLDRAGAARASAFPEGELFTWEFWALGLQNVAELSHEPADVERAVRESRRALVELDAMVTHPPHDRMLRWALKGGVCWFGGQALVRERMLALAGPGATEAEKARARHDAQVLADAFGSSRSAVLEAHPDARFPVDSLFALEALQVHDRTFGTHLFAPAWARYLRTVDAVTTGVPASMVDAAGEAIDVPRGCALSWTLMVLPRLDPVRAKAQWRAYREGFFSCDGVPCLVREYPRGVTRSPDADSGPVVNGFGMAATAFALGAARANGDATTAERLERTGELFGAPQNDLSGRRYAGGAVPLLDVLALYVRTVPLGR